MSLCQRHLDVSQPCKEIPVMIAHTFQDAFSAEWVKTHLPNRNHDLVILRQLKCSCKINFMFITKIFDEAFDILDQMTKALIGPKFDPFIFHKTP